METQQQRAGISTDGVESVMCQNCRATMVRGMRFCRNCGYRLGEGMEEYVETVRFDGLPGMMPNAPAGGQSMSARGAQTTAFAPTDVARQPQKKRFSCAGGGGWMMWLAIAVAIFAATGGGWLFKSIKRGQLGPVHITANTPHSFFGTAEGFETTPGDDGAMITAALPGSPADKAGLIGGDIVISFDGHSVHGKNDIREKLRSTPAGKTVEVEYVRDGETKKTLLTTISEDDYDRDDFLPDPKGQLGISGLDRVHVAGLNIHGVQVGNVRRNNPADLAGWKDDDIVIEFDGTPIRTSDELGHRIDRATPGNTVKTIIIRNGEKLEIPVKVGRE